MVLQLIEAESSGGDPLREDEAQLFIVGAWCIGDDLPSLAQIAKISPELSARPNYNGTFVCLTESNLYGKEGSRIADLYWTNHAFFIMSKEVNMPKIFKKSFFFGMNNRTILYDTPEELFDNSFFFNCNLTKGDISKKTLQSCRFQQCRLDSANFAHTYLFSCSFAKLVMFDVNLTDATLRAITFDESELNPNPLETRSFPQAGLFDAGRCGRLGQS